MYPHRIRLRGPWEAEPLDPPGEPRRVHMPARLGECGLGDCHRVMLRRWFGRPRRIDDHERVWLVGEGVGGRAEFQLNGQSVGSLLGEAGPFAFPVTHLIAERNELSIELTGHGPDAGLHGDVALEIRCQAYLDDLRAEPAGEGRLRVSGHIGGEAGGSLDLYVLVDCKVVAYRKCRAGDPFELTTDESVNDSASARVELVAGAVVWHAVDVESG